MRMFAGPRDFSGEAGGGLGDSPDLKPSEDDVKFRGVADESEHASSFLGAPKASEEKKQIAASYLVPREMALRGSRLPEDWTPSRGARDRVAPQIGIEMRTVASADAAARQVFDNRSDR